MSRRKIAPAKGNLIGFVRLLNENVSFISVANAASSSFIRLTFIILIIICVYFSSNNVHQTEFSFSIKN